MIADKIEALLADKRYDTVLICVELAKAEIEAVISSKSNRCNPIPRARIKYRR